MKTKIITIILKAVFILSITACSVDSEGVSFHGVIHPESPLLEPPLIFPGIINTEPEDIYTEGQQQQIRQNLIGRYRGVFNNQLTRFDIRSATRVYIDDEAEPYAYTVAFDQNRDPLFVIFDTIGAFYIQLNPDNNVTGLRYVINPEVSLDREEEPLHHDDF